MSQDIVIKFKADEHAVKELRNALISATYEYLVNRGLRCLLDNIDADCAFEAARYVEHRYAEQNAQFKAQKVQKVINAGKCIAALRRNMMFNPALINEINEVD